MMLGMGTAGYEAGDIGNDAWISGTEAGNNLTILDWSAKLSSLIGWSFYCRKGPLSNCAMTFAGGLTQRCN